MRRWLVIALGFVLLAAFLSPAASATAAPTAGTTPPLLHVSGDQILDESDVPVQLNGVNRAGTEYACIQGWGIFDGPNDQASVAAIASWHVHVVRVPLNEDCWLDVNTPNPSYSGRPYRSAVKQYVRLLEGNGMNVILDLHWAAPGTMPADHQLKMPNVDHTPGFWRSMTRAFGQDRAVLFDLFNEPHDVTWECWLRGCMVDGYRAAGMQRLVNTVRNAGGQNILLVGGLGWSGDLTKWRRHMPQDPLGQLVASWHNYDFVSCTLEECWAANVAGVAGSAPVLLGEVGEVDCEHGYVDPLMAWADGQGIGYLAWTWDDWSDCNGPTLIEDYSGTPTAYGQGVHDHFVSRFPALG